MRTVNSQTSVWPNLPTASITRPVRTARRARRRLLRAMALLGGGVAVSFGIYRSVIRPWQQRWGATVAEVAWPMAGDDLVRAPYLEMTTRAVTVHASPEYIWPWLVQMGNNRGGLYSYDWLDTHLGPLDQPSVNRVLPEFQNLIEGDVMPYAKGTDMLVQRLVPYSALLLVYTDPKVTVTQSWGLYPLGGQRTRLVIRVRAGPSAGVQTSFADRLRFAVVEVTEFPMTRQQLLGIKWRAEALAAALRRTEA
jgi:hypothetical protein